MEYKQIQELIKTINKSGISELSIEEGDFKITIKQDFSNQQAYVMAPAPAPMQIPVAVAPQIAAPFAAPAEAPTPAKPAAPAAETSVNTVTIKSPMIGTFYRSPSPDKPVFVNVGDEVVKGQKLCIIEAMKLFNDIESDMNCRIVKVLADDSSPVEYDQPLFLVEPL
jgi:acetyl-CoA carboxylase biotin carboxyl carrier protein